MLPFTWRAWLKRRRRRLIGLALLVAFFYALGYFSHPVTSPLMCRSTAEGGRVPPACAKRIFSYP